MARYKPWGLRRLSSPFLTHLCLCVSIILVSSSIIPVKASSSRYLRPPAEYTERLYHSVKPIVFGKALAPVQSGNEIKGRVDLRHIPFITIDPKEAHELDDAVYVESLGDYETRIRVAIADPVSLLIQESPELLQKAIQQGFTRYEENPVKPLFPESLTAKTSLMPGRECPALVVDYKINAKGVLIEEAQIYQATMQSSAKLNYDEVNLFFKGLTAADAQLSSHLSLVSTASLALKKARLGASSGFISSEQAIAEIMISANMLVAQYIQKKGMLAPFRVQDQEGERAYYTLQAKAHANMKGIYTHFTSPLRRLPDCLVHAALFYPEFWQIQQEEANLDVKPLAIGVIEKVNRVENQIKDEKLQLKKLKKKRQKEGSIHMNQIEVSPKGKKHKRMSKEFSGLAANKD